MENIVIIGVSCSGKTTLGKKLASCLEIRAVDLDELHWKPGWKSTPLSELLPLVEEKLSNDGWVISGNYSALQDYIFSRADTIIWLDYSPFLVARRALGRTLRRALFKEACCNGNYETFRQSFLSKDSILLWVLKTYKKRKIQYQKLKKDPRYKDKNFIHLRSQEETNFFLNNLS